MVQHLVITGEDKAVDQKTPATCRGSKNHAAPASGAKPGAVAWCPSPRPPPSPPGHLWGAFQLLLSFRWPRQFPVSRSLSPSSSQQGDTGGRAGRAAAGSAGA